MPMLLVGAMYPGELLMLLPIIKILESVAVSQSPLGGTMELNHDKKTMMLWEDIRNAKNKGEILHAVRQWASHYGMHSNMPNDVYKKLEDATTHFYR